MKDQFEKKLDIADDGSTEGSSVRLHKYLSQAGICSRRKAEEYIASWLVRINGEVAGVGAAVRPGLDTVEFDDRVVEEQSTLVYYMLNKPRWVVTTCEQPGEKSILDIVEIPERVFPVWRLDKESTGLILLTNDGRLSNYLMHPRYEHEKEYQVEIYGKISDEEIDRLEKGVWITDNRWTRHRTLPCTVDRLASGRIAFTLREGKNRQIRRMLESLGHEVKRLKRVRIESVELGDLPEWAWRELNRREKQALFAKFSTSF